MSVREQVANPCAAENLPHDLNLSMVHAVQY